MARTNFEDLITELEDIVTRLEKGETSLEESIKLYSRGTLLAGKCRQRLAEAEELLSQNQPEANALEEREDK